MFQMPRGKFGNVDNGFDPRRARAIDSGGPAPVARAMGEFDLSFLWRRKRWIAASVAAALVVCFVADLVITPRYRAAAQILIGPVDLRVIEKDVMPLAQTADANVIQVESETRVLTSDKVLLRVVEGEQLASDPEFRGRGGSSMGQAIAAVLAPQFLPRIGSALTPAFRSTVRGAYRLGQKSREALAEAQEHFHDIAAEVNAEDGAKSKATTMAPEPKAAAA